MGATTARTSASSCRCGRAPNATWRPGGKVITGERGLLRRPPGSRGPPPRPHRAGRAPGWGELVHRAVAVRHMRQRGRSARVVVHRAEVPETGRCPVTGSGAHEGHTADSLTAERDRLRRDRLRREVDDLRAFEREYRTRLTAYLEGLLEDLRGAPA